MQGVTDCKLYKPLRFQPGIINIYICTLALFYGVLIYIKISDNHAVIHAQALPNYLSHMQRLPTAGRSAIKFYHSGISPLLNHFYPAEQELIEIIQAYYRYPGGCYCHKSSNRDKPVKIRQEIQRCQFIYIRTKRRSRQ